MAVTFANSSTVQPLQGTEVAVATIVGGPFDNVDAFVSGGGGSIQLQFRLYVTVGTLRSLVAEASYGGPPNSASGQGTVLRWSSLGKPIANPVTAGGTQYDLVVYALNGNGPIVLATLAGVNTSDTATAGSTSATVAFPAIYGSTTITSNAGYAHAADVGVSQSSLPACAFDLFASCGGGSVEALVAFQNISGGNGITAIMRQVVLPAATTYRLAIRNLGIVGPATVTASLSTYSGGSGGGSVVLSPEVTGPSNNNVVSGPFSSASLAWKANVLGPTLTQLQNATTNGQPMTIRAQAAATGSGGFGDDLQLGGGLGDGAGFEGGVAVLSPYIAFADGAQTPTIYQYQSTSGPGQEMTLQAQDAKAGSGAQGGNLSLSAGAGDGAGAFGLMKFEADVYRFLDHTGAIRLFFFCGTTSQLDFSSTVTTAQIIWERPAAGGGNDMLIRSQSAAVGSSLNGGNLSSERRSRRRYRKERQHPARRRCRVRGRTARHRSRASRHGADHESGDRRHLVRRSHERIHAHSRLVGRHHHRRRSVKERTRLLPHLARTSHPSSRRRRRGRRNVHRRRRHDDCRVHGSNRSTPVRDPSDEPRRGSLAERRGLSCRILVANKNGTVTLLTAIATSSNPINSNTAGFLLTSRVQASDAAFNTATCVISINGLNQTEITVTNNNGGGINADVTVLPYVRVCGSI